mmetsp:Transcript_124960/g.361467  ORF Transcript_124960/g.361467 Transcript_124960/m.361467 type:complete len:303 (+) Transcript_124960:255-1163(+)
MNWPAPTPVVHMRLQGGRPPPAVPTTIVAERVRLRCRCICVVDRLAKKLAPHRPERVEVARVELDAIANVVLELYEVRKTDVAKPVVRAGKVAALVHKRRHIPNARDRGARTRHNDRLRLADALPERSFAVGENLHGAVLDISEVGLDDLLITMMPNCPRVRMPLQPFEILLAGEDEHEAGADAVPASTRPIVPLSPHPRLPEQPVQASGDNGIGVQPHQLVELRQAPDLQLPIRKPPRRVEGHVHAVRHLDLLERENVDIQRAKPFLNWRMAIGHVRRIGEEHQREARDTLERAGQCEHLQ